MVTTIQYPHILQKKDNGNWVDVSICKDSPNDKGKSVPLTGGVAYLFSSLIYLPKAPLTLLVGEDVRVLDENGKQRISSQVKRFSEDIFHSRLWV